MRPSVWVDADGHLVGEEPDRARWRIAKDQTWQIVAPERGAEQLREVSQLLPLGREPHEFRARQDGVEHHQPLDGSANRSRLSMAIMGLPNRLIERAMLQVKDADAPMGIRI